MDPDLLAANGFLITAPLFDAAYCAQLARHSAGLRIAGAGSRQLLDAAQILVRDFLPHRDAEVLMKRHQPVLDCRFFEIRALHRHRAGRHQRRQRRMAAQAFGGVAALNGWSEKEGQLFVQPPSGLLDQLLAVRLHIDDCALADGPLRVVPGSPRRGRLSQQSAMQLRADLGEISCPVAPGSALLLRPLLLHASSKASGRSQRRVLHFVFGPRELPYGLQWPDAAML